MGPRNGVKELRKWRGGWENGRQELKAFSPSHHIVVFTVLFISSFRGLPRCKNLGIFSLFRVYCFFRGYLGHSLFYVTGEFHRFYIEDEPAFEMTWACHILTHQGTYYFSTTCTLSVPILWRVVMTVCNPAYVTLGLALHINHYFLLLSYLVLFIFVFLELCSCPVSKFFSVIFIGNFPQGS